MSDTAERLRGGQVWTQRGGSCLSCYLVFLDIDQWVRINPPDRQGNIAWSMKGMERAAGLDVGEGIVYTSEQLAAVFDHYGYECEGQFADLLEAELR